MDIITYFKNFVKKIKVFFRRYEDDILFLIGFILIALIIAGFIRLFFIFSQPKPPLIIQEPDSFLKMSELK